MLDELASKRYEFLTSRGRDAIVGVFHAQQKLQTGQQSEGENKRGGAWFGLKNMCASKRQLALFLSQLRLF